VAKAQAEAREGAGDGQKRLALRARARKLGLWGRRPHTLYDPTRGISTRL
jgi:hypothetical protein